MTDCTLPRPNLTQEELLKELTMLLFWNNIAGDYIILALIAKLLRTSPNPMEIIKSISIVNNKKQSYKNQFDWEPGFFIPPEELDEI
jgi:hypothetical protein